MRVAAQISLALLLPAVLPDDATAQISSQQIDAAFSAAQKSVREYQAQNDAASSSGYVLQGSSSSVQHQRSTHGVVPADFDEQALLFRAATLDLVQK